MKIGLPMPSPEEVARGERQLAYTRKAEENRDRRNKLRVKALGNARVAIDRALAAYRRIEDPDVVDVRIRTSFVYTEDPRRTRPLLERRSLAADVESRPIMTKLVARRSSGLRLLLSAIYVAQMDPNRDLRSRTIIPTSSPSTAGSMADARRSASGCPDRSSARSASRAEHRAGQARRAQSGCPRKQLDRGRQVRQVRTVTGGRLDPQILRTRRGCCRYQACNRSSRRLLPPGLASSVD